MKTPSSVYLVVGFFYICHRHCFGHIDAVPHSLIERSRNISKQQAGNRYFHQSPPQNRSCSCCLLSVCWYWCCWLFSYFTITTNTLTHSCPKAIHHERKNSLGTNPKDIAPSPQISFPLRVNTLHYLWTSYLCSLYSIFFIFTSFWT